MNPGPLLSDISEAYAQIDYVVDPLSGNIVFLDDRYRPDPYDIEKSKRKYKESRLPIDLKYGGKCKEGRPPTDICDQLDKVMRDRTKPRWKRWAAAVAYWKNGCFNK